MFHNQYRYQRSSISCPLVYPSGLSTMYQYISLVVLLTSCLDATNLNDLKPGLSNSTLSSLAGGTSPDSSPTAVPLCSSSCTYHNKISCKVTKRSSMCIHRDESATDFPNAPRDLAISYVNSKDTDSFNITWGAPYDYSYKAVTGYELHVSMFGMSGMLSSYCYFVNLSTTDWDAVPNVHEAVYFVDCVQMSTYSWTKMHVKIFSYPKLADNHLEKSTDTWIYKKTEPRRPSTAWEPHIDAVQDMENRSLVVLVEPRKPVIHSLIVCISPVDEVRCAGKVYELQGSSNVYRYRVAGLTGNHSYYIYIKPRDKNNMELDTWLHMDKPMFLDPWPLEPEPQEEEKESHIGVEVVIVIVVIILILCFIVGCILWNRGYLNTIPLLKSCLPRPEMPNPKILHLYENESEVFKRLVATHQQYMLEYIKFDSKDCEELRDEPSPDHLLAQHVTILVYMSPQLMRELECRESRDTRDANCLANPFLAKKAHLIHSLVAQKGPRRKASIIFILPDCWDSVKDMESYLSKSNAFKSLPRFSIESSPQLLVRKLSRRSTRFSQFQAETKRRQELRHQIDTLLKSIKADQANYSNGRHLNGLNNGIDLARMENHIHCNVEDEIAEAEPMLSNGVCHYNSEFGIQFLPPSDHGDDVHTVLSEEMHAFNKNSAWDS